MSEKHAPNQKSILALFIPLSIFTMACSCLHPVTPTLIVERGLNASMFGIAFAAAMFTMFLMSTFWGQMCNYMQARWIVRICAVGYAIGQLIFGTAQNEATVIAGRMFAGCFSSGAFTAIVNYIINTNPDKYVRGRYLTVYATISTVGSACGYFVGGMMGLISVNFTVMVTVALLLVFGLIISFGMVDDSFYKAKPDTPLSFRSANPFAAFAKTKEFMNKELFIFFAGYVLAQMGQVCTEQEFQYYIKAHFGLPSSYNGTIKVIVAVGGLILNSTLTMWVVKKADLRKFILPLQIAFAIPFGLMLLFSSFYPLVACYVVISLILVIRTPIYQNITASSAKEGTSNVLMGFYQSLQYLASCIGGLVSGLMYNINELLPFQISFVLELAGILLTAKFVMDHIRKSKA